MTHPPNVRTAPRSAPPFALGIPPAHVSGGAAGRGAWAEGRRRPRAAATREAGRLRIIGAVLAAPVVAFSAVTVFDVSSRATAPNDVVTRRQRLTADASAPVYRSLADADTAASNGFPAGAEEPRDEAERYDRRIPFASRPFVVKAATDNDDPVRRVNQALVEYREDPWHAAYDKWPAADLPGITGRPQPEYRAG